MNPFIYIVVQYVEFKCMRERDNVHLYMHTGCVKRPLLFFNVFYLF